ncbi:MAG: CCA tRNA nucleotidyltransferase [Bdellovibrionota bacterium]
MITKKIYTYSKIQKTPIFLAAKKICFKLQKSSFESYFVGGCVRDFIRAPKKIPKDIDIATSASPENIKALFPGARFVGEAFGVCLVQMDGFRFEVATFRVDGEYVDKRRPQFITMGNMQEDSCRRDFAMNALYYDPQKKIIKDIHGGIHDIKNKIIRCVGNPELRFAEDALRVLRALRFCANFGFELEKNTQEALQKYGNYIEHIAKERILTEFSLVKNFYKFTQNIIQNLSLKYFFQNSECFEPRLEVTKNPFYNLEYPFMNFLLNLTLFYEIKVCQNLFHDVKLWPLTRKDASLCQKYLQIFLLKNSENVQFQLFVHLKKIYKICPSTYKCIVKNSLYIFKSKEMILFIKGFQGKELDLSNTEISGNIVEVMKEYSIPERYTQKFIDYCHYINFIMTS